MMAIGSYPDNKHVDKKKKKGWYTNSCDFLSTYYSIFFYLKLLGNVITIS